MIDARTESVRARRWRRFGAVVLASILVCAIFDRAFPPPIPDLDRSSASVVLASDGSPLRAFPAPDGVWRYRVREDEVAPEYLAALIGYEDRWFAWHLGVNPLALLRAMLQAASHGEIVSGGSTLTMQVARLIEPIPRTPGGKLLQIWRAGQLELRLSKAQILTLYLNLAPFGGNIEGVEAASWAWLGKSARQLSHAEAALLAVLPQAPSRLRPDRYPLRTRIARDKVLQRLADLHLGSRAALDQAQLEPVTARSLRPPMHAALLAQRLREDAPGSALIHSTIDPQIQTLAERRVAAHINELPERSSAAVLVVDNQTLAARAYVGSAQFGDERSLGHVDMVRAIRSPGSTLKPFVYGLALDDGLIHSESLLVDAPQAFDGYRPTNFGDVFHGPVSASEALSRSLNVPAVDLLQRVGPRRFAARLAHAGVDLQLPRGAEPNLSLILGGVGTRLEELVGAYAALARDGLAGRVRLRADDPMVERRLLGAGAAFVVREMLLQAGRPGDAVHGLDNSRRARLAFKTGTSYGYRDAWAIGVTAQWTIGVWIGRPDGTPMPGQYGAATALPLLFALADSLPRNARDLAAAPAPTNVAQIDICWPSGTAVGDDASAGACTRRRHAWIIDQVLPPTFPDRESHEPLRTRVLVDARSGLRVDPACSGVQPTFRPITRWPALLQPWLSADERQISATPMIDPRCDIAVPALHSRLRIDGAIANAVIRRAPGSAKPPTLALRALGTDEPVDWLVNGRLVGRSHGKSPLRWRFEHAGEQAIVALARNGRYDRVVIQVQP